MIKNRWREFRETKGWTQEQLGEKLGLSKQMISKIENEEAHTTTKVVAQACVLFNCGFGDLYPSEEGNVAILA